LLYDKITEKHNTDSRKEKKTMLFVHGYGCDQTCGDLLPAFETYKIVLIDLVGSGQSDLNAYDFDKYNTLKHADLLDLIEELCLKMSCWSDIL
jgi:sigma-B regulation protein RsbQ